MVIKLGPNLPILHAQCQLRAFRLAREWREFDVSERPISICEIKEVRDACCKAGTRPSPSTRYHACCGCGFRWGEGPLIGDP
jgi:hypothetical protein